MSSNVYLNFKQNIKIDDFLSFCKKHNISFSPNTVGQNYFYQDQVQIQVSGEGTLPEDEFGRPIFSQAKPPASFNEICIGSYFMSNLDMIATCASSMLKCWSGVYDASPELEEYMKDAMAIEGSFKSNE